ncbi:hypothetical protein LZF95_17275 [Algoriphagus sp. AGSA1]|uniref:hypothetical protein n=1 Tax=Algoriphagus sp. AGSA1 TaxID=2907213 RepID=UPI001F2046B3|nr:hypothetical protein [Algoriphagus sp. AGSA1]MCE7056439.1 hypothetical protein [Algoriphagus sp. AGSA1]
MKLLAIAFNLLLLLAASMCSSSSGEKSLLGNNSSSKKVNDSCLMDYTGENEGKFFTEEFIKELANGNPITSDHYERRHMYRYSWKENGVIHFIGFDEMETAEKLRLKRNDKNKDIPNLVVDYTKNTYRDKTPEEAAKLNKLIDDELGKSNDPNANASSNKTLQNTVMDMQQNAYIPLDTKADYAVYNRKGFGVYVVVGEVLLSLSAQVGPYGSVDEEKSVELARKLADKVAGVCN